MVWCVFFCHFASVWVGADRVYFSFLFSVNFSRLPWHSVFLRIFVTRPSSVPSCLRVGCLGPQSTCSMCGIHLVSCLGVGFDWDGYGLWFILGRGHVRAGITSGSASVSVVALVIRMLYSTTHASVSRLQRWFCALCQSPGRAGMYRD